MIKEKFEKHIYYLQDRICSELEAIDSLGKFEEDIWKRPGGGGGKTRILNKGKVFEKGNNNSILPKLVNGKIDAVDNLLNQFHPSYRNKEIFNSLTASIKLDSLAILAMVILMILLIFRTLKQKDSHSIIR